MPLSIEETARATGMSPATLAKMKADALRKRKEQMGEATGDAAYQPRPAPVAKPEPISPGGGPAMLQMRMREMGL